jgi:hypothetical protein|tara:strand:+ start:4474 stop:4791 length:318 start_codon:yes stop_codon:yes gene_type:complete
MCSITCIKVLTLTPKYSIIDNVASMENYQVTDQEHNTENFFQAKYEKLLEDTKSEQIEMMYLKKENNELSEKVKNLGSRQPSWPKGYRPARPDGPRPQKDKLNRR